MSIEYPEHDKLRKIASLSQAAGEFMEWANDKGYALCLLTDIGYRRFGDEVVKQWLPVQQSLQDLLAEHFGIDLDKIETEKRAMLDTIREMNA